MQSAGIIAVVSALNHHRVRYLIVGGLAVVAHGYLRLTEDIDLVIDLGGDMPAVAMNVLTGLGYHPRAPVQPLAFADADQRRRWRTEKDMVAFNLWHDVPLYPEVDLFIECPFDFTAAYAAAVWQEIAPEVAAPFVDRDTLIAMKLATGRAKDADDVRALRSIGDGP